MRCLAISASSSQRQLLSSVLKEIGFSNVVVVSDIKTCLEMMEAEEVGWIIGPLQDASNASILQLLDVINQQPVLRHVKVSILRDQDHELLPKAFAMGALSCHRFAMTREACLPEFKKLLERLTAHEHDFIKVAASYLQEYLHERREFGDLRTLYTGLLQVYPGNADSMLALAHTLLVMGELETGKVLLHQVKITGGDKLDRVRELSREFFESEEVPDEPDVVLAEHFGFRSCLVVDPTPESLNLMKQTLLNLGFGEVYCHRDPLSALKWLRQNKKLDLLICEWKLPNLPGPVFLYKLRNRLGLNIPLLVINESIEEREVPLLSELGASRLLQKPIDDKRLNADIIWTLQQHTNPTDPFVIKQKLLLASKRHDVAEIKKLKQLYFDLPALLEADKLLMEAQIAFDSGCFLHAKKHALDAMRLGGSSREAMEILGKSLMKLRDFDAAVRCLSNVSFISPMNVSHLCNLAECHLEQGNDQAYDQVMSKAQDLDEDAAQVIETAAKGAIKRGHTETAKKLLSRLKSFKEVLAFMNNRAVSLIRVGNFEEGVELYKRTLESLPENQQEMRALIHYNLGLGLTRANRLEDALKALSEAERSQNQQRIIKAKSLKTRIVAAVNSGETLVLKSDPPISEQAEQEKMDQMRQMEASLAAAEKITRSDYCLINIYRTTLGEDRAQELLAKKLNFSPRGKLVKDYHRGLVLQDTKEAG
ncbi:response regulator [Oligoflexus tunisiensis]|uniref:response regulator n=1 Tax=Oligoflexus tunisiensis TaxID=708132 RepID=UPI00114CACA1|nr:response regulator [Oligoflexus tunisiensis]